MAGSLSDGTTVLSNLSLQAVNSNGTVFGNLAYVTSSGGTSNTSTGLFSRLSSSGSALVNTLWASSISVAGTLIPAISSTSSLVAAFVVQGSASSFTRITWAAVQPGDQILTTLFPDAAVSSMSSGLVPWSHCTIAGFIELRLSNVSTLQQNQSSKTFYFTRISPF